jgi:3-deoxy-manno-octulosonate cytidylyltransferase (CMP-KDO synthetase)
MRAARLRWVIIATDDERIAREARRFGAEVRMTRRDHPSGTDRVAEVAAESPADLVVNIQGDEPLIDPAAIDAAVDGLEQSAAAPMATLARPITDPSELDNPNVVKVVTDRTGHALYFSRYPIPFVREGRAERFKHIGLYVYRRDFLLAYPGLPRGPLEEAERLEQLRALENGYKIRVVETDYDSCGVDTPEDLARAAARLEDRLGNH